MTEVTVLRPTRALMRDPSLPHQIVLHFTTVHMRSGLNCRSDYIGVSCNCRAIKGPKGGIKGYEPFEVRTRWDAADALAVYRAHLDEVTA